MKYTTVQFPLQEVTQTQQMDVKMYWLKSQESQQQADKLNSSL